VALSGRERKFLPDSAEVMLDHPQAASPLLVLLSACSSKVADPRVLSPAVPPALGVSVVRPAHDDTSRVDEARAHAAFRRRGCSGVRSGAPLLGQPDDTADT